MDLVELAWVELHNRLCLAELVGMVWFQIVCVHGCVSVGMSCPGIRPRGYATDAAGLGIGR